jgi:alpha-L-rhamnosidase
MNSIIATKLTSEYAKDPIGLAFNKPRLSWIVDGTASDIIQEAYRIQGARTEKELLLGMPLLFDTDWVVSSQNSLVAYPGDEVPPASSVYWRVKIRTDKGEESDFSEIAFFETSIETLSAEWISSPVFLLMSPCALCPCSGKSTILIKM